MKKIKLNKYLVILLVAALAIVGGLYLKNQKPTMILFYSDSCPHCQNVEKYIAENNVKSKLAFEEKEVSKDQANATLLERKARQCGLDVSQGLGVPFFFDGQACYMGDQDIINYFQKK